MKALYTVAALCATALAVWLFLAETAARPGPLSVSHAEMGGCTLCHIPWRGASEERCLECHGFSDVGYMRPEIRFHEAEKHCLGCHSEHRGDRGMLSRVDHALFNGDLQCTRCHTDIHGGLFGAGCRKCHGIETWEVPGFRHPPREDGECGGCHRPPLSHQDKSFWGKIEESHVGEFEDISQDDCMRCHTTDNWRHLIMGHSRPRGPERARLTTFSSPGVRARLHQLSHIAGIDFCVFRRKVDYFKIS